MLPSFQHLQLLLKVQTQDPKDGFTPDGRAEVWMNVRSKTEVLLRAWLRLCDSSGVTRLYLFSSTVLLLLPPLPPRLSGEHNSLSKAQLPKITAPFLWEKKHTALNRAWPHTYFASHTGLLQASGCVCACVCVCVCVCAHSMCRYILYAAEDE